MQNEEQKAEQPTGAGMEQNPLLAEVAKCSRCKVNDAQELHTCPYAEDIHGDSDSLCDCCADCEHECCMDI